MLGGFHLQHHDGLLRRHGHPHGGRRHWRRLGAVAGVKGQASGWHPSLWPPLRGGAHTVSSSPA